MILLDKYLRKYAFWRKWRGLPEPMSPEMAAIFAESLSLWTNSRRGTIKIRRPVVYARKD